MRSVPTHKLSYWGQGRPLFLAKFIKKSPNLSSFFQILDPPPGEVWVGVDEHENGIKEPLWYIYRLFDGIALCF